MKLLLIPLKIVWWLIKLPFKIIGWIIKGGGFSSYSWRNGG